MLSGDIEKNPGPGKGKNENLVILSLSSLVQLLMITLLCTRCSVHTLIN